MKTSLFDGRIRPGAAFKLSRGHGQVMQDRCGHEYANQMAQWFMTFMAYLRTKPVPIQETSVDWAYYKQISKTYTFAEFGIQVKFSARIVNGQLAHIGCAVKGLAGYHVTPLNEMFKHCETTIIESSLLKSSTK